MEKSWSLMNVIKLAGAYIAFTIGSGFATGQEVMQFFTAFGMDGIIGALVSMLLFSALGAILMAKGYDLKLKIQATAFRYYCGKYVGIALEIFTVVLLFCVVSIMVAGTGAVSREYFGISPEVGGMLMAIICLVTILLGLRHMVDIIGSIGPVIIVFTLIIGIQTLITAGGIPGEVTTTQLGALSKLRATNGWWFSEYGICNTAAFSGILYAACMILGGIPFLSGLGASAKTKTEAIYGGIAGGVFLMIPVIILILAMLCYPDKIATLEVPNLFLADQTAPVLSLIFSVILLLGIYSTAAPMLWSVVDYIGGFGIPKKAMYVISVILTIITFFGAKIGFGNLIGLLYPLAGQLGVIMIPVIIMRGLKK